MHRRRRTKAGLTRPHPRAGPPPDERDGEQGGPDSWPLFGLLLAAGLVAVLAVGLLMAIFGQETVNTPFNAAVGLTVLGAFIVLALRWGLQRRPSATARCRECGAELAMRSTCRRCGRDNVRLSRALREGTCVSCGETRNWLSRLMGSVCEKCGAPHCPECKGCTYQSGWGYAKWTCWFCGHVNLRLYSAPA